MRSHDALVSYVLAERPAGVPPLDNADVYRRTVRANLSKVIGNAVPVTAELMGEDAFEALLAEFFDAGGPSTPYYRDIPQDFVSWVVESGHMYSDLMGYEWLELRAARHPADVDALAPLESPDLVRPNPTIQVGVYNRAVHQLGPSTPEAVAFDTPQAYLVWRQPVTDTVCFHRVGLVLAQAFALSFSRPCSIATMVARTASILAGVNPDRLAESLADMVRNLRARGGVIG